MKNLFDRLEEILQLEEELKDATPRRQVRLRKRIEALSAKLPAQVSGKELLGYHREQAQAQENADSMAYALVSRLQRQSFEYEKQIAELTEQSHRMMDLLERLYARVAGEPSDGYDGELDEYELELSFPGKGGYLH